jgi:pimeloyl-ACP methyl ester carboxylesterase
MKRIIVILAAVGLLAPAAYGSASASTVASPHRASAIDWGRCEDRFLRRAHARCAMLDVPLDYDDPGGAQIQIAISRVLHTVPDDEYQRVMLVNPGGPGGSGLGLATLGGAVPHHAGDAYDWIGFDPRGVGSSEPAISCIPKYFHGNRPPYVPTSDEIVDTWLARAQRYAEACEADAADLLPHMTTIDAAKDLDSIREALGVDQINYYGFSYGTYLGQVYATLFPGNIRRAVFDGNVDPRNVWYQANLNQDVALDRNMKIWFEWLARYQVVYHLGRTAQAVERRFYAEQQALTDNPAGGIVGPAEWTDAFVYTPYCECLWTYEADVFASWVHDGDARKLIGAFRAADTPGDDNLFAVYNAVQCSDVQWPQDWATWEADNSATHEEAPFFTWGNAWFNAACLYWAAPAGTPVTVDGGETPVLLINETLDAATPYEGSLYVRSVFPGASLIAEPGGTTHAGSLGGNACVDDKIAAFLSTGELPPRQPGDEADVECAPLPRPVPDMSGRARHPSSDLIARLQALAVG